MIKFAFIVMFCSLAFLLASKVASKIVAWRRKKGAENGNVNTERND